MSDNNLDFMNSLTKNHEKNLENQRRAEAEQARKARERERHNTIEIKDEDIPVSLIRYCDYDCEKFGIPILPVCYSRLDYKLSSRDERFFNHSLTNQSSIHDAITSMSNRTYLYVYVESTDSWKEYYSGKDGAFNILNVYDRYALEESKRNSKGDTYFYQEAKADPDLEQPFNCSKPAHSTLATKYITVYSGDINWLMISHTKLSKEVLKKYSDDKQLRSKRMQNFVGRSLTNNVNTVEMTNSEISYIESFYRRKELSKDSGSLNSKTKMQEKTSNQVHKYSEEDHSKIVAAVSYSDSYKIDGKNQIANQLYEHMNNIAMLHRRILPENKPMMVALPDPVGEVLAAAEKRNYLLKKLDDKYKDKSKIREQVNAIIIDNIRKSLEASVEYDSTVPQAPGTMGYHITGRNEISQKNNKNIYNYINQAKFQAVLEEAKKSRQDKAAIAAARQTFVEAITNPEFARVMREDFPKNDEDSHVGYAQIIAQAIQGIGIDENNIGIPDSIWADYKPEQAAGMTAKQEFEQSLLPCITGDTSIEDNWLIKALIGLDQEDINRMQDAPTFENLARASDFVGTATNWAMAFKAERQKRKIKANIARDIQRLNDLANYKAQVVQTISSNMSHIKDNNKWLYRVDLWTQATVHQATGFKLAQRVLRYSPEAVLKWSEQRLSRSINKAKPHATLLPASIDNRVVSSASSVQTPIAIDLVNSHGVNQTALDIFDKSANGNEHARTVVTMYASEDIARTTQTINEDITRQVAQLNSDLDPINGQYSQLERQSAGKAALVSVGIGLFQLRSIWMGKSSLGSMARRGDRAGLEFMTAYASTTLALTTASLDVANAGLQMKAARSAWVARLSLSVGVLGAVGAGFEVYSLSISLERQIESKSQVSAIGTGVAMVSAGVAGVSGAAIALGFTMPWLVGIMAVAWGVSLIAQWVAFRYDKGYILPIHYWLDAGVFGNKAMLNDEYPNNPFKIQAMGSLEQDMHAYSLALTEIQVNPKFATNTANFRQTLSGQIEITLSQWNDDSELVVEFIGIGSRELGLDRKSFNIETLKRQNKAIETSKGLEVILDIPKTSHFQAQYLGSYKEGTRDPNKERDMQEARERAQVNAGREVDKLRAVVKYALNPSMNPYYQLRTSVTSQ